MANYPKELTDLLQDFLKDSKISYEEKEVLLKKANQLGVDPKEFEVYIESMVNNIYKEREDIKEDKKGRRCPHCGGSISDFVDTCEKCGKKIKPEASKEVEEIINALEDALVEMKSGKDIARNKATVERYQRKVGMYYGNNPTIQKLLADIDLELKKAAKSSRNQARTNWCKEHKFLTFMIVAVVIIAIIKIFSSVKDALTPETYKDNPQICLEEMRKAIAEGDILKAEAMYNEYGLYDSACKSLLGDAYFAAKDYKAAKSCNLDLCPKIIEALMEDGKYSETSEYLTHTSAANLMALANDCIVHMLENNVSEVRIRAYIKGMTPKICSYGEGPDWYEHTVEKSLLKVAGLKR